MKNANRGSTHTLIYPSLHLCFFQVHNTIHKAFGCQDVFLLLSLPNSTLIYNKQSNISQHKMDVGIGK